MRPLPYARHRFPPAIIQHAVWLYFRFALSYRDIEDMLAERDVSANPGAEEPSDNAYINAFNSRLGQECLNASWFLSMGDARARIEAWRIDYNPDPIEFAGQLKPAQKVA